jgi:hypothetical protein
MNKKTQLVNFTYKVLRTAAARFYYLRYDLQYLHAFNQIEIKIPDNHRVESSFFRQYRNKWLPWSESVFLSRRELDLYCYLGHNKTIDYMPNTVYFTTIDPILNNKQMAWGYSEKGQYFKLFGIDNEPVSLLRYINGLYYDFGGNVIRYPDNFLENKLKEYHKVLIKPVVESWGGRYILVFEREKSGRWKCINDEVDLELPMLVKFYKNNFVIQEYLTQHPFYERFNSSSFNTIRLFVYRSSSNEVPYVLHSLLKVGQPGSVVDNLKAGSIAYYIKADGKLLPGISKKTGDLKIIDHLPSESEVSLESLDEAPGFKEIHELAKRVSLQLPFHRLVALDTNIDASGKPRLVELNLCEAGNLIQLFGFPFLGKFTEEVIEYCKTNKKVDFLRI